MKFNEHTISDAKQHALSESPRESCGLVVSGKYVQCRNMSADPLNEFKIEQRIVDKHYMSGKLEGVIHSHYNSSHLSFSDMEAQMTNDIPWMVINVNKGAVTDCYGYGSGYDRPDLLGRKFINGQSDCWALVCDWHREKGIELYSPPRDNDWWKKGKKVIEDNMHDCELYKIDRESLRNGDVVVFQINSKTPNHTGIYDDGLVIHHLQSRLSRREPIHIWFKYIHSYWRLK